MTGTVCDVSLSVNKHILTASALVRLENGRFRRLRIPGRELAALLPKSLLCGPDGILPDDFFSTAGSILRSLCNERKVIEREISGRRYLIFHPWTGVFLKQPRTRTA